MIDWSKGTKKDYGYVEQVVDRMLKVHPQLSKADLEMDLIVTHTHGCPLDFDKLLGFDKFNFLHDIVGIVENLNRDTGGLENCFLPRCSV